eukprot:1462558-Amphidinium_carterae.2
MLQSACSEFRTSCFSLALKTQPLSSNNVWSKLLLVLHTGGDWEAGRPVVLRRYFMRPGVPKVVRCGIPPTSHSCYTVHRGASVRLAGSLLPHGSAWILFTVVCPRIVQRHSDRDRCMEFTVARHPTTDALT